MAVITSNGTGGGAWNTETTWTGGVKPANGDSVVIAAGDTVTFDADHLTDGIDLTGLTINGTLQASTTAGVYPRSGQAQQRGRVFRVRKGC